MKKNKSKVDVIQANNYVRQNPHSLITQGNKYVTNGSNNDYFYFVEDMYLASATNQAIIDNYVNYVIADGLEVINGISQEDLDNIIDEENLRLLVTEYKTQGNSPIQVVYSKLPDKKVAKLYSLPAKQVAIVNQDDLSDEIERFWFCYDWNNKYKFKPYEVPSFGFGEKRESEIFYLKRQSPQPLFSLPDYQSGLQYCKVEEEISNYFINHIQNNFSAGKVVNIYQGEAEDEEAEEQAERIIKKKLSGTSNAGNIIVAFNKNTEEKTTIDSVEITDAYQQFDFLSKEAREKIMLSHKVNSPSLFGFSNASGFSDGGAELDVALKHLYRSQINPIRRTILSALEEILSINSDRKVKLRFKDFEDLKTKEEEI